MTDGIFQIDSGVTNQRRVLFKPGSWLNKVDFINHLVLFNNVLIAVLAEKEGGKTSFASLLQNHLDPQIKSIFFSISPPCDQAQIINDLCARLHLNHEAKTDLASVAKQINERKSHVLLIIDQAQNLPESMVKEFLTEIKAQDEFGYFHLCFISDYSVIATLNTLALDQFNNLIHTIEIGPLSESETRTYVLQRAMALRLLNKPLSDIQFKKFYQTTKGNITKINNSLEAFINKVTIEKQNTQSALVKMASIGVAASIIAGVTYLYVEGMNKLPAELNEVLTPTLSTSQKIVNNTAVELINIMELGSEIVSWQEASTRELVHNTLSKQQVLDDLAAKESPTELTLVDKALYIPPVHTENRTTDKEPLRNEGKLQAESVVEQPKAEQVETKNNEPLQQAATKSSSSSVDKSGYTIQLVASHNKGDIYRFRETNKLLDTTQMRQFKNKRGTWYILTYGEFNSPSQATREINKLPQQLNKLKPWVRAINGLEALG